MKIVNQITNYISKQENLVRPAKHTPKAASKAAEEKEHPSAGGKVRTEIFELVHRGGKTFERRRTAWVNPKVAESMKSRKQASDWIRTLGNYLPLYFVGGFIRDKLFGKISKDIDVVTLASMDDVKKIFDELNIKYFSASKKEETLTFKIGNMSIDITAADAQELVGDLARRDFTINAVAQNVTGNFYDPFKGLEDAKAKILRSPRSNSKRAFKEDPLRILRAARFIAAYNLKPHSSLLSAIEETKGGLSDVATERIGAEIQKIMEGPKSWVALEFMREHDLLDNIHPSVRAMVGFKQNHPKHNKDVWGHTIAALKSAKSTDMILNLSILLHDVGKPDTSTEGGKHFIGHDKKGAEMSDEILSRLHFSSDTVKRVHNLIENHMFFHTAIDAKTGAYRRLKLKMEEDMARLVLLARADTKGSADKDVSHIDEAEKKIMSLKDAPKKSQSLSPIDGSVIMEILDLKSGPRVGEVLGHLNHLVEEDQLEHDDIEGAKRKAREYFTNLTKSLDWMIGVLE